MELVFSLQGYEVFVNQSAIAGVFLRLSMVIQFSNYIRQHIADRAPGGMPLDYAHPEPPRFFAPLSGGWSLAHLCCCVVGYGLLFHYLAVKYLL